MKNSNKAAFPEHMVLGENCEGFSSCDTKYGFGLTKREYAAIAIMGNITPGGTLQQRASYSVALADALLEELEKKNE